MVFLLVFSLLTLTSLLLVLIATHQHRRRLIEQVENLQPIPWNKIPGLLRLNFNSEDGNFEFKKKICLKTKSNASLDTIEYVRSLAEDFPVRGWLTPWQMMVAISDPDDVQTVLGDPRGAEKAYFYKFFNSDHGLLASQRENESQEDIPVPFELT